MYFVGWGSSSEEGGVARGGGHHICRGQFWWLANGDTERLIARVCLCEVSGYILTCSQPFRWLKKRLSICDQVPLDCFFKTCDWQRNVHLVVAPTNVGQNL